MAGTRGKLNRSGGLAGISMVASIDLEVTDDGRRSLTAHDPFLEPGLRVLVDVLLPLARPE